MPFTQAQLAERRKYLGGSEAAAAVGLSPYFTPYLLYLDKVGQGTPIQETLPMKVGTALEPVCLALLEEETGLTVSDRQTVVNDRRYSWRRATLDGRASDGWLVEGKASSVWQNWGKEEDAVPASIIYQCQHQLACDLTAPGVYVPVILGGRQFRVYKVKRDAELINHLTVGEDEFWEKVIARTPPDPMDMDDIKIRYPQDTGVTVTASPEVEALAYKLANTKAARKAVEATEKQECFDIAAFMKDAAILVDKRGEPLFTHKAHTERRLDVKQLRKDHPAIADLYSPESTARRLLCKIDVE
jgi:putative phage-type endonuclease